MKITFKKKTVIIEMTIGQLDSIFAALDSVSSLGVEDLGHVYSDIPKVETALGRARYVAERKLLKKNGVIK